jgi:hypothetical protein
LTYYNVEVDILASKMREEGHIVVSRCLEELFADGEVIPFAL